jgi:hypothetical protein
MFNWLIHRKLRAFEREHDYDASYMHEVLGTDAGAFMAFARATPSGGTGRTSRSTCTRRPRSPSAASDAFGSQSSCAADRGLIYSVG